MSALNNTAATTNTAAVNADNSNTTAPVAAAPAPTAPYHQENKESKGFLVDELGDVDGWSPDMVFIKTLENRSLTIDVEKTTTVGELKKKVSEKEGMPLELVHLVLAGKELCNNELTLVDCGVGKVRSAIQLTRRFIGA